MVQMGVSIVEKRKKMAANWKTGIDQFNVDETQSIVKYLTDSKRSWALIVVSNRDSWITECSQTVTIDKGEIKSIN